MWGARVDSNFEIVGFSSNKKNALIINIFPVLINDIVFEIKWANKEWISVRIEDIDK